MSIPMPLSKSDFMLFLRHPAWLWLKKHDKARLPPIDDNLQAMFDAGHQLESYAEQLFPNATKLGFRSYGEYLSLPARTARVIEQGASTVFQGRLEVDGLTCIFDVLRRVDEGEIDDDEGEGEQDHQNSKKFDLIEIKSSTKAKPEHHYDLAFQLLVLEKAGYSVRKISVLHLNKDYIKQGEIDPQALCAQTDITPEVKALLPIVKQQVQAAQATLNQPALPDISPRHVNQLKIAGVSRWFSDWLEIFKTLQPNFDPYNLYQLSYPSPEQIGQLEDAGISTIANIPDELALRPKQLAQIKCTRQDQPILHRDKIKQFLESFQYPLYFFDYETLSSAIPLFDGMSPYADYPFQYSLHLLRSPVAKLEHREYLHDRNSNPMPELLEQLKRDIGDQGTVLTWNMSYEKDCNKRMVALYPQHAEFLAKLNERIEDLMTPFAKMWYFHKDFFGSVSIKKVLPVLASELSYQELNVGDGLLARRTWMQTVLEGKNQADRAQIMDDLKEYCRLDTLSLIHISEPTRPY